MIEPARLLDELADREELEDALLDLLEAVVVVVQDLLGAGDVLDSRDVLLPRHADRATRCSCAKPSPRPIPAACASRRRSSVSAFSRDFLRHARRSSIFFFSSSTLVGPVVLPSELLVDGLDLLVEVVLLLGLLHLLLDLVVDAAVDVDLLDLDLQQVLKLLQALGGPCRPRAAPASRGWRRARCAASVSAKRSGSSIFERRGDALEGEVVGELRVLLEEREHLAHVVLQARPGHGRCSTGSNDDLDQERSPAGRSKDADPPAPHPSTITLMWPLGKLQRTAATVATTPTSWMSVGPAARRAAGPSAPARKSRFRGSPGPASRARMDDSRPTTKGAIWCGKTTMSRSGRAAASRAAERDVGGFMARWSFSSVPPGRGGPTEDGMPTRPCAGS